MIVCKAMDRDSAVYAAEIEALCFSSPWPLESFLGALNNSHALYLIAFEGDKAVGYIGVYDLIDEISIINIATHPGHRNKGAARLLMSKIHEFAAARGVDTVTLEVRESNIPARTLYESFAYKENGRIKNYYSDPKEDAVLYKYELQGMDRKQ